MNECFLFLKNNINVGETVVVAVSGGPDSMALIDLLSNINHINIVCAHVNHNVRKESYDEKKMVEEYCHTKKIKFEYMVIEKYNSGNFHSDARNIRYHFFEELMHKYQSHTLITAHHGDDLMESILMRIVRGSSLKGYSGFSRITEKTNYRVLRPFITITKADILKYVNEKKVPYAIDQSNFKDVYTRNRYRKYIVPRLKDENKSVHKKFYKFHQILSEYYDFVSKIANEKINDILCNDKICIDKLLREENLIQKRILEIFMEKYYCDNLHMISDSHLGEIYKLINSVKKSGYVNLPNNFVMKKSYNFLSIEKNNNVNEYLIKLNETVFLPNGKKIKMEKQSNDTSNNTICLSSKDISLPLYVRTRKNGDTMIVKGMNRTKKINDIFIDNKIPIDDRNMWPILIDAKNTILWLPGLKKSKFDISNKKFCDIIIKYY